jgi:glucose 1-dehydrogenase
MAESLFRGQTALITGAGSGIGRAVAIAFGKAGMNVVINFHSDADEAEEVVNEIMQGSGKAIKIQADVTKEVQVTEMFEKAVAEFGSLDVLVNNAGIEKNNFLTEMTLAEWQVVIDTNLTGYFLCAREAAREFKKKPPVKEDSPAVGKMIFISSVHDNIPWAGHANYTASKGGVMMFMKSIAQELAPFKIRVNCISPGAIKTSINKRAWSTPQAENKLLELIPYKRIGEPEDIARIALWLASDNSDYITGEIIYADGGMMLYPSFMHGG